ncbi:MAG TPA: hypothetical protein VFL98_00700 [Candidatus Paceibacterota bacterium]|nr:hypothetical protein [Candidatus Paceibacterota bacterium]
MSRDTSPLARDAHLIRWILALIAIIIVGTVFFGGYSGLQRLFGVSGAAPQASTAPADLTGALVLSVGMTSASTGQSVMAPLLIWAATGARESIQADQLGSGPAIAFQYSISRDSNSAVFLATPIIGTGADMHTAQETPSIYRADTSAVTDSSSLTAALQAAASVADPTSTDYFREFPVIAPSTAILYSSLPRSAYLQSSTTLGSLDADAWNIDMLDPSGAKTTVATGLYPKWVDATHFAFLKDDGIYVHDLASGSDTKVWNLTRPATATMGFDVSDDGQFAAVTDPADGSVQVIRALNWPGGILSTFATLPITATNPVLSPDDHYLAMVALQPGGSDPESPLIPTLEYYSLTTQQFLPQSLVFDPTTTTAIYLTDWR